MRTFALRRMLRITACRSPKPLFSLPWVNATSESSSDFAPAGAGISVRPFTRSQRRFRHHCEVRAPDLYLRFHAENHSESVRSLTPPLRSVSRPNRGEIHARNPLSASVFCAPEPCPAPTPRWVHSDPLDQSVQPVPFREARLARRRMVSHRSAMLG